MEQIKEWYQGLEQSEQQIVLVAAVFFSLVILFFGLLKPLNGAVEDIKTKVNSRQSSVNYWKQSMPTVLANRGRASASSSNMRLGTVVTTTTRRFNLSVSRVNEKGPTEIQVWFDNVPFNDFIRWVAEIESKHQVTVASVNVRSKERDGLSSIDIKLQKG